MNQSSSVSNPWHNRAALPSVPREHIVLAVIACLLCAIGLPFCAVYDWVPMALVGVSLVYIVVMAHVPSLTTMLLLTAIAATLLGGGILSGAWLLALIVGAAATTFLFTVSKSTVYAVMLPVVAAGVALAVTKDLPLSMLALSFLPAGILLGVATLMGKGRTTAVCFAIGGFLAVIVAWVAFAVHKTTGELTAAGLRSFVETARGTVLDAMISVREQFLELSAAAGADEATREAYDRMLEMMSDDMLRRTVATVFNVLPGIVAVVCSILAFEAQSLLNATYRGAGLSAVLTDSARQFTMSLTSAILFAAATLLMLIVPTSNMFGAVAENLSLVLLPGFFLMGSQGLLLAMAQAKGNGRGVIPLILMLLLCCCSGVSIFYVLAMWGALGRILFSVQNKLLENAKNDAGGNDRS